MTDVYYPPDVADRFWDKIEKSGKCWIWRGALSGKTGASTLRGSFHVGERSVIAHRVAWELATGRAIPDGMFVLHRCDNSLCMRPDHLFLGTQSDNIKDMWDKGGPSRLTIIRHTRPEQNRAVGERHPNAKITGEQAREIVRAIASGASKKGIARQYGINHKTVQSILAGKSWAHATGISK